MPGRSFLDPIRYQTQTLAVGLRASGASKTRSPFSRRNDRTFGAAPFARGTPGRILVPYNAGRLDRSETHALGARAPYRSARAGRRRPPTGCAATGSVRSPSVPGQREARGSPGAEAERAGAPRVGTRESPLDSDVSSSGPETQTIKGLTRPLGAVRPVLRLMRLENAAVSFAGAAIGGWSALGGGISGAAAAAVPLALAGVSTASVTAGGNVLNDLFDRDTDRVNHPDRPLVTGAVSVTSARVLVAVLFAVGIAAAVPLVLRSPITAAILVAAILALLGYELAFKAAGFGGNLLIALLTGAVFLYGAAAVGRPLVGLPFALMAAFATLSREVIKDMEDAAGDVDRRTLPRTRGFAVSGAVARSAVGVAIAFSPAPIFVWALLDPPSVAGIMYIALVLAADALFVVSVLWLPERLHREQVLSKGAMTVALLAFVATAFR
jgi:geranylgeranylglycerol-phosphate geranylgeranyltransferase